MSKNTGWLKAKPFAHRGLHDKTQHALENTRTAFARALDGGYNIELDLQISKDGEAMVFHDPDFARLAGRPEKVNSLTAGEIKKIRLNGCDDEIQTLGELLEQVNGKADLLIELKTLQDGSDKLARRAIDVLKTYNGKFGLMSFDPSLVGSVKTHAPEMIFGAVAMPETEKYWQTTTLSDNPEIRLIDLLQPDFVSYDYRGFPAKFAEDFTDAGKPVISWTIKDQAAADFAYQYCDQITFEGFSPKRPL